MIDPTEWMTAVDNDNSECKVGVARVDTFCNRLNDVMEETNLAGSVVPFTLLEIPWLTTCCAEHDAAQAGKSLRDGTTSFDSNTETPEEEFKELIMFDGDCIQVFDEKDPMVIDLSGETR